MKSRYSTHGLMHGVRQSRKQTAINRLDYRCAGHNARERGLLMFILSAARGEEGNVERIEKRVCSCLRWLCFSFMFSRCEHV